MEPLDYLEVDDIEVLEVLSNPLRVRILRHLMEPASVKEIAEALDVPPTRLYYHVNLLEGAGVIAVVETRKVGAMLQKIYQSRARGFRPSPKLPLGDHEPEELARIATGVILDGARVDAEEALTGHFGQLRAGDTEHTVHGALGRTVSFFTREEADEFAEKLSHFIEEEFDRDRTEGGEYGLTIVFFPLAGVKRDDDG